MKTRSLFLTLTLGLIFKLSYCDIIPENSHYVDLCVQITNINDYPEISLLCFSKGVTHVDTYEIPTSTCLNSVYKYNSIIIYSLRKSYLDGKDISILELPKDGSAVRTSINIPGYYGYVDNSNPLSKIARYYKIVGFTDSSVVVYKWKESLKYNNGKADSIAEYSYDGDIKSLSQTMIDPTASSSRDIKKNMNVSLFPNPVKKDLLVKINNDYRGNVFFNVVSSDGKIVKSVKTVKKTEILDYVLPVDDLRKTTYSVAVIMGDKKVTSKIVIE